MKKLALALLGLAMTLSAGTSALAEKYHAYFGTYTRGDGTGIYVATFDTETGKLGEPKLAAEATNPSFLAIHPSNQFLYAVGEVSQFEGKPEGGVVAFRVDQKTGLLSRLNSEPSKGAGPCHLVVDDTGRNVLAANYGGGSVVVMHLEESGRIAKASDFAQHEGSSVDPRRQKGPHAHSINVDPQNRFAVAADLGLDKLLVYRFDPKTGKLEPNDPPFAKVKGGGGPRHFDFHPSGKFAYSNLEMTLEVVALDYDPKTGTLNPVQTISTLPEDVTDLKGMSTAETRVHPNGKFVYVSNRGHDSIAAFRVDQETGKLTPIGHTSTGGNTPRNFNVDPSGQFILAANQSSNNVVVLKIDQETGKLSPTGEEIEVPIPVCVRFVPAK